jgi:hypothetical protein
MTETIEQLKTRSQHKRAQRREQWDESQYTDSKRWAYTYLNRKQKQFVDSVTTDVIIELLEHREYVIAGWAIGVIADKWLKGGYDSDIHENPNYLSNKKNHEQVLHLIQHLFDGVQGGNK